MALVASVVAVVVYTLIIGLGLLSGRTAPERAYGLIALPALVPVGWYLTGFLRQDGRDYGLIASAAGWLCAALTLWTRHLATQNALSQGVRLDQVPTSPATWVFALLALAGLIGGAIVSGRHWLHHAA